MFVAAAAGLFVNGLYRDPTSVSSMLRAYDLVTLTLVVPVLAGCLVGVRRQLPAAEMVWVGLLAAAVYTYAFHIFGTTFNALFLVHVATFSAALFALILALCSLDVHGVADQLRPTVHARPIAAVLALLALGLGGMWIAVSLRFAATGEVPTGSALVETDTVVHLGIALDLALLVPTYAAAAALLWRRAAWGYTLAAVVRLRRRPPDRLPRGDALPVRRRRPGRPELRPRGAGHRRLVRRRRDAPARPAGPSVAPLHRGRLTSAE